MTRGKYPNEARSQAFAMIDALERRRPGVVERLRVDPLVELEGWNDLAVVYVDEPAGYDRCSVAGSYLHTPPTLRITVAASQRRNGFTGLHELGHHLQKTDITLGGRLFEICPHDSETLEEEACDAFAAEILLPGDELRPTIGPNGPVARDVADLFERSSASREACCVWAARHLQGAGVVYLLDADGVVQFAAPHSFIPARSQVGPVGNPLDCGGTGKPGRTRHQRRHAPPLRQRHPERDVVWTGRVDRSALPDRDRGARHSSVETVGCSSCVHWRFSESEVADLRDLQRLPERRDVRRLLGATMSKRTLRM